MVGNSGQEWVKIRNRSDAAVEGLGVEGYLIKTVTDGKVGRKVVLVFGADPHGTNYGVLDLAARISAAGELAALEDLNLREKPRYALRGIYAHQHWTYNRPYALRSWTLKDWQRYIDILASLRVNLLQLWSMVGIIPDPANPSDWEYLSRYEEIIRYAKDERGMQQVWPGECVNNIATSTHGMPIEKREYFVVEELRNPADPKGFQQIMDNRRNLYKATPSADGYWILDSDPGKWVGSPASDFRKIFQGNRELIDQYNKNPERAKLVYWMLFGWGTDWPNEYKIDEQAIRASVRELQQHLKGPLWATAHNELHLKIAADNDLIPHTVYFPYGTIEHEPSAPLTKIRFDVARERYRELARYPEIGGMMGNSQTPLLQLPNIYFFSQLGWDPDRAKTPDREVIRELALKMYPEAVEDLADGWYQLSRQDSEACRSAAARLEQRVQTKRLGRAGIVGQYFFPDGFLLLGDLATSLRMHGAAIDAVKLLQGGEDKTTEISEALQVYLLQALILQQRSGYHIAPMRDGTDWLSSRPWFIDGPDYDSIRSARKAYASRHPDPLKPVVDRVKKALQASDYDAKIYGRMIDFLLQRSL